MSTASKNFASPDSQIVCIDLPGEKIECWRSSDKIKVVLRKHRDVIFELKLGQGKSYTVESTGSDFYNSDEKKLILGDAKGRVSFKDGDRLHLWITREFKGELLLRCGQNLMMRIEPEKFDMRRYDREPKTKPDPIIIALGQPALQSYEKAPAISKNQLAHQPARSSLQNPPLSAQVDEDCAIVCVIDGILEGMPTQLLNRIKNLREKYEFIDLDPYDIVTRNWILGQVVGIGAYASDNWEWLRASIDGKSKSKFKLVRAKISYVKGKARYYFSGYSKYNTVFGPGGFGSGHDRISTIFGGAGKTKDALLSTAKGVAGTFKGTALVSFIFGSAMTMTEWKDDVTKDGYDLAAALLANILKAIVSAALTAIIVALIVCVVMFFVGASMSVIAVGALTVGIGVAAGFGVDVLDKKLGQIVAGESNKEGLSAIVAEHMRQSVKHNWEYLKKKLLWDYEEFVL